MPGVAQPVRWSVPPGAPPPTDPALASRATALVERATGASGVTDACFLSPLDAKKNRLVAYRVDGERRVLKIYRQSVPYTVHALRNPLSRYVSRAFTLHSLARTRLRAELETIAGFRAAGVGTFEVLDRPRPAALVFRREPGEPLRERLQRENDPDLTRRAVARVARDMARRHAVACERGDLRMVHPAPRLQHVWRRPDGTLLHFDFEDRVNPSLRVPDACAMEVESFFFYLLRCPATADERVVAAARRAVGEDALLRWERLAQRRRVRLSGSARRRLPVRRRVLSAGASRLRRA